MILTPFFLLSISRKLVHAPRFYPFFPEKWQHKNGHEIFYSKEMQKRICNAGQLKLFSTNLNEIEYERN